MGLLFKHMLYASWHLNLCVSGWSGWMLGVGGGSRWSLSFVHLINAQPTRKDDITLILYVENKTKGVSE